MLLLLTLYHLAILALLLLGLGTVLINLRFFDGLTDAPAPANAPRVSILVPARNEEKCVGECVESLLAQDYPNWELIVLDDHSTDATPEILAKLGQGPMGERLKVLRGEPLPAGWVGKNWACHQLARVATGDFLFFTDADTTHAPGTVRAAVAYAERTQATLVSAWPRLITVTLGEKLVIPMILLLGMTIYPHWLLLFLQSRPDQAVRLPRWIRRSLGAANGQFMFWRRSGYERVGGHEAVHNHLVEDVALGRAVAAFTAEGLRLRNCEALQFSTCRMYRSFAEVWEGFTKNMRPAFEGHLAGFIWVGTTQVAAYGLPFLLVFLCWGRPEWPLILAQIATIATTRIILTRRFRTSWTSCWLHPISEMLGVAIGLNSWRLAGRRGVTWKGRRYTAAE